MKKLSTLILFLFLFSTSNNAQIYEEDIYEIVDSIVATVNKKDRKPINTFFAKDSFLNLIEKTKVDIPEATEYRKELKKELGHKFDFGNLLLETIEDNYYDFINYYESVDNEVHVLFRLLSGENGAINYHDFILTPINDTLQIIDVYYFRSGQRVSKSYNEIYLRVLRNYLNSEVASFFSREDEGLLNFNKSKKVNALYEKGEYQKAYDLYSSLPKDIVQSKSFRLLKVNITTELGDTAKFKQAVDEYQEAFPDDPSLHLVTLDRYFIDGKYEEAMRCVNKLDIAVGLDDFLNYLRGNIYYAQNEFLKAQEKYEYITTEYPGFMLAWTNLIVVYHETKQYSELTKTLTRLESELEKAENIDYMKTEYVDFCKTQEFKDWEKASNK